MLGLFAALLLAVIHVPESGVVREVPLNCRWAFCVAIALLTLYAATYPWHQLTFWHHAEDGTLEMRAANDRAICQGLHALSVESRRVHGAPQRQALWAAEVLRTELFLGAILFITTFISWFTINCIRFVELRYPDEYQRDATSLWTFASFLRCFDCLVNTVDLALFSGILWQGSPPEEELDGCSTNFWEELLDGHLMPSFDPCRSQTNDVVRQAIIPSSRVGDRGRALAELWEERPVLPQNMVTHHWSNSFAHLLGAILADALKMPSYAEIAEELCTPAGVASLSTKLQEANQLGATYWVCAVSVNQHASICGGYGPEPPEGTLRWVEWDAKRHDSVSSQRFELCNCQEPKRLSHCDAACELNKFDDMICFLSHAVSDFGHLIVVDQHFDVLYRAWCDALERMTYEELAEELCSLSGVTHIRRKLREAQRLESTYWVCAFSVNQHASICGGYGPEPRRGTADWKEWDKKRHDSVSFHRFKLCDCHEPKLMSHQEAACELNKHLGGDNRWIGISSRAHFFKTTSNML
eukprot:g11304.t1